jgi:hypothetical protein
MRAVNKMPSNLGLADSTFPRFTEEEGTRERVDRVYDYLYQLLQQLRYTLANLDSDNFNDTGLDDLKNETTAPLKDELEMFRRVIVGEGGSISDVVQTGVSFSAMISDLSKNVTKIQQTVNGITLSAENGKDSSTVRILSNGVLISSAVVKITGMVTFADLSGEGTTTINGANVKTGTISAISINSCTISGSVINGSEINLYYGSSEHSDTALYFKWNTIKIGQLSMFTDGVNSLVGVMLKSENDTALKLEAGAGMSLVAKTLIYMESKDYITLNSADTYIYNPTMIVGGVRWKLNSSGAWVQTT